MSSTLRGGIAKRFNTSASQPFSGSQYATFIGMIGGADAPVSLTVDQLLRLRASVFTYLTATSVGRLRKPANSPPPCRSRCARSSRWCCA